VHVWVVADVLASKPVITKVTQDPVYDFSPFISHNGRWLVFSRGTGTHRDIWLRDVASGHESVFLESAEDKASAIVDDSGETVVFETHDEQGGSSLAVVVQGKPPQSLCTRCSRPSSWFDGNRAIFYQDSLPSRIRLQDLKTGTAKTVLASDNVSLGEASWSPENQYLLFSASSPGGAKKIFAVFFPRSTARATGEWIPIADGTTIADRGRWSGDGKYIFYLSTRDGWPCIWGQNFNPQTRRIIGPPFPIVHLHNPRISPESIAPYQFQLSAAGNSVYLNLGEASAAIWIGRFRRPGLFSLFRP
jgi:Tol biopolymer transport system component